MPVVTAIMLRAAAGNQLGSGMPMKRSLSTRFQNSRRRLRPSFGGPPTINAALIAPIDVPTTQSGVIPASASA